MGNEKGSFSADISQSAIEEALKSVERRTKESSEPEPDAGSAPEVEVQLEAEAPVAPASVEDASTAEVASLKAQLELSLTKGREMMEKVKDSHERMLRAAADLDNFKKRAQREREEAQRYGTEKLLKDFLPVMDNLERALDHARQSPDLPALLKGVQMTRKQFEDALGKNGVKGFSALGQVFDPRVHEAMQQQERADLPPNQVVMEMARGYFLHERLIRPALVVVSTPKAAEAASASAAPTPLEATGEPAVEGQNEAKEGAGQ